MKETPKIPMVECPGCQAKVEWVESNEHRPFCSQRCRDEDFCNWANGEHRIGGDSNYDDLLSEDLDNQENRDD